MHKVMYVSHMADRRGSAVSLHQLMLSIDRSKFTPMAVFSKPGPLVDDLVTEGIPSHVLLRRGVLRVALIRDALALIRRERVNLVHLNSAVSFCKYVAMAARVARIPVVWHVREDPNNDKRVRRFQRAIRLFSDRILVVSTNLERFFASSGKVVKIFNGVDVSRFRPGGDAAPFRQRYGIPVDALVFGMVGSIEVHKGQKEFLQAASLLPQQNIYLVIVGSGPIEQEMRLKTFLAEQPRLAQRTILTGKLSDIPEALAGMDVLVMASHWEGCPRALIEAMACGKPAIATAVGEIPQMIQDGETGFVVGREDVDGLTLAMLRCVDQRDQLAEMGRQARMKALREFTIEQHVQRVQLEYESLLQGERG
jgi:glycosyltransferase involved in cell wall biosynthesis